MTDPIRFDDGAAYERYMGVWSQLAGDAFLEWLAPAPALRWLDVGCGNGAFTELLTSRCAPHALHGIDPSPAQLAYARTRPALRYAELIEGDAMALPYADDLFDVAVMPLVIFFVPVPATGVAEMARVVRPGGLVAAYAWDMHGGAFPYHALQREMRELGAVVPAPPSTEASRLDMLRALWDGAGLVDVATHEITVQRTFASFADYWSTILGGPSIGRSLASMSPEAIGQLQDRLRACLPADEHGQITYSARANAVRGRVPQSGRRTSVSLQQPTPDTVPMTAPRLSEERYRTALDGLLEGVNILDADLRYVYVNPAAAAQGRQQIEDLIGRRMRDVFPGVEHSDFHKTLERIAAGAPACRITTPFDFADGDVGYFQLMLEPMAGGGVFLLSLEITAQVRAEAAMNASEARQRALLEGLPDLLFLLDRDGVVLDLHAPDSIPLLRTRESLIGHPLTDVLPPDVAATTTELLARVLRSREPGTLQYELQLPNGLRSFEATIAISADDRFTVVVHDATDRVTLEEQLRQSQKMEAVGQLTGGIAHDFNNLLTVISANASLLAESSADTGTPVPVELHEIMSATRRGAVMVSQLLQFSRRGALRRQLVDPAQVVARISTMLARVLPESVQLSIGALAAGHTLSLDTGALDQIITNLCTNARDAMPDGGTIRIDSRVEPVDNRLWDAHQLADSAEYYRITVQDSGIGMTAETQSRLFEPFFTTKPFGAGTGLGLSMVYGLMRSHQGRVEVQSAPGQGAAVHLYFPIVPGPPAAELVDVPNVARDVAGGHEAILVVEDDAAIRVVIRRALEAKGYRVWDAADGALALATFRAHEQEIALVLSDLVMPNMGGRQMAEAMRAGGSRVPILFTSGYSSNWIYDGSGVPDGVLFMPKPWTLADLYRLVRDAITAR